MHWSMSTFSVGYKDVVLGVIVISPSLATTPTSIYIFIRNCKKISIINLLLIKHSIFSLISILQCDYILLLSDVMCNTKYTKKVNSV